MVQCDETLFLHAQQKCPMEVVGVFRSEKWNVWFPEFEKINRVLGFLIRCTKKGVCFNGVSYWIVGRRQRGGSSGLKMPATSLGEG